MGTRPEVLAVNTLIKQVALKGQHLLTFHFREQELLTIGLHYSVFLKILYKMPWVLQKFNPLRISSKSPATQ